MGDKIGWLTLLVVVVGAAAGADAKACLDPLSETRTFFAEIPQALRSKEIVAKVKIISSESTENHAKLYSAKIVSAIRGVKVGSVILIATDPLSSCDRDPEIHEGSRYYVAGSIGADGKFHGTWKQRDLIQPR